MEGEGFVWANAGALGEPLKFVHPVGGDGLDAGALLARPFKGGRGGQSTISSALHGFGELKADEVAEALAVLEAELAGGTGEFGEGEVDGRRACGVLWGKDTRLGGRSERGLPGRLGG